VKILKATYGSGNDIIDVTERLQALVTDGRISLAVSNDLFTDPCPGIVKTLRFSYEFPGSGQFHFHEVEEHQIVMVPNASTNPEAESNAAARYDPAPQNSPPWDRKTGEVPTPCHLEQHYPVGDVDRLMTLLDMYVVRCFTPSDIHIHLPRMVDLVLSLDAQHVIELGSRSGVSTIAWLYALEHTGGRLTSIDLAAAPDIGTWPHWTHVRGDDLHVAAQLEQADIVFIDTSHVYEQTAQELNVYRWLVNPGGVICGHDSELAHPEGAPPLPSFPVKRAVAEFCAENGLEWTNVPDSYGFYIIKFPEASMTKY
jgi:hypothetical protein